MNKEDCLFYEDMKTIRQLLKIFMVLFYIGAGIGIVSMIVFLWIIPNGNTIPQELTATEQILITTFTMVFAILINIYIVKAKKFKQYVAITKSEIIVMGEKLYQYEVYNFKDYELISEKRRFARFKLTFNDVQTMSITIRKTQELKSVLDKFIKG